VFRPSSPGDSRGLLFLALLFLTYPPRKIVKTISTDSEIPSQSIRAVCSPIVMTRCTGTICENVLRGLARVQRYWRVLCARPGVAHAMDDGDCAHDCDDPQNRRHAVEERSQDYQDETFRALHESDPA